MAAGSDRQRRTTGLRIEDRRERATELFSAGRRERRHSYRAGLTELDSDKRRRVLFGHVPTLIRRPARAHLGLPLQTPRTTFVPGFRLASASSAQPCRSASLALPGACRSRNCRAALRVSRPPILALGIVGFPVRPVPAHSKLADMLRVLPVVRGGAVFAARVVSVGRFSIMAKARDRKSPITFMAAFACGHRRAVRR